MGAIQMLRATRTGASVFDGISYSLCRVDIAVAESRSAVLGTGLDGDEGSISPGRQ